MFFLLLLYAKKNISSTKSCFVLTLFEQTLEFPNNAWTEDNESGPNFLQFTFFYNWLVHDWALNLSTKLRNIEAYQRTKTRKKLQFQMCVWVVAWLLLWLNSTFFWKKFLHSGSPSRTIHSKKFQTMLILAFEANGASCENETKIVKITHSEKGFAKWSFCSIE